MQTSLFTVLGPVMIGPSSSHTAGAVRLGNAAHMLCGGEITSARFLLHGSFAETGGGHGTDRALVAGVMGLPPTDVRIRNAFDVAKEQGLAVSFERADLGDVHPNTVRIDLTRQDGSAFTLTGSSIGGGGILLVSINGIEAGLSGEFDAVILTHMDKLGVISKITEILAGDGVNIVTVRHSRESRGSRASTVIELDSPISDRANALLEELEPVLSVSKLVKIL